MPHPRKFIIILLLQLIAGISLSQEIPVHLKILNQKKEPVGGASVTVLNRLDSTRFFQSKVADLRGSVVFNLEKGQFQVKISSINYQPLEKGISIEAGDSLFVFQLEPLPKTLSGVVVISQRPLMRQEDDKTIVDPENLVASSTSGYEVIEKTPGLFVDQDGNIYISSTQPATVQINGRELKMSASDVATLLKSLPPQSILSIEILRTPSAKNDASSSGGIVNVVLKKGIKIGKTGSVTMGLQQGNYGNQFAGFNLNNNDGNNSSFINLNISQRNSYERIFTDRRFAPDSALTQNAYTVYPSTTYFGNYGFTRALNRKWEIDISGSLSINDFNNNTDNESTIRKISTNQLLSTNLNRVSNDGFSLNNRAAIEATLKIDSLGSEWVNDIFYNYTKNSSNQEFVSNYIVPSFPPYGGDGKSDNDRHFFHIQSDLKLKLKKRLTLETGIKGGFLYFTSVTDYFREFSGIREKDPSRTNTFRYQENINALYAQASKTLGKNIVIKVGSRLENTNMNGRQVIPYDTTFKINRTDLFPYVYLSKNIMQIAGFDLRAYLVYRRTINRPVYEQLNPFPRYIDQYLSEIGNPSLRPQFTTNYEANISVDERPILAVGYNDTKDIFTNVIYQADSSQSIAYRTYDNLGKNREWYFRGLGAIPPGKKYFFVLGGQYNYNMYDGLYENEPLRFRRGSWTFFTYHNLKLDKRSQITLNGFVRFKGQQQFYELGTFGSLNASINRRFLKDQLAVTLSINDIFATNKNDFSIRQGSVSATGFRQSDTRRVGINLRYNFGMRKKEENNDIFNTEQGERSN